MPNHPDPLPSAAAFLRGAVRACSLSRSEIAQLASLSSVGELVAMERGQAPIPYRQIPALAYAVGLDDAELLLAVLAEYEPDVHALLTEVMGLPLNPTESALVAWHRFETLRGRTRDAGSEHETFTTLLREGASAVLK